MKKLFLVFSILFLQQSFFAQTGDIPAKKFQKGFAKLDFLSIKMPEDPRILNEPNMGFSGIHYNLFLNDWAYTGVGIYGAVSGERGGFFTLGINAGIKKYFSDKFYVDAGFHFGGGGGAAALDGGGAFILPHANIGYDFKKFSINTGWSYVDFFDGGAIKNHQLNVSLEIPLNFDYANSDSSDKEFEIIDLNKTTWNQKTRRSSLMAHFNNLKAISDTPLTDGTPLKGKTIRLAGFEFSSYLTKNWFSFVKVDGAYDGIRGGYMNVFLGGGYNLTLNNNNTNILAKFGIGAGGGGGVDTNGGFLIYPDVSIEQRIFNDLFISVNKGYLLTPNNKFTTSTLGFGLKYYVERGGTISENKSYTSGKFKTFDVIIKQDLYFDAERMQNPTENLHQISLQLNINLNKNIFVAGQTSFANFGNAGAYAEGLVGFGLKTNTLLNNSTSIFTQFLAGASGGGNISTGQGLIAKPSAGIDYKISDNLKLRAAGGYVKAQGGSLSSAFINLGINYNISFLKLN